ncbi:MULTISPECIES: TOPRIM nucleotidyl transferase/hydrolase domain-containing protein [Pseudomonas]|uniref:TOPRIM nucleotidyl transferase/hydrolase domain-containing protein n=1 Tax=Pseudomonas TaxID=286 RepID=UPI0030DBA14F
MEDILYDEMITDFCEEVIMKNAAIAQCIYIFVEGDSEEAIFQRLLEDCGLNFNSDGIFIANYNGIGNLKHAIRLLRKTLSHDRPIIVTYDDDLPGKKASMNISDTLITTFKIPQTPVVNYSDGSSGGSLEEVFTPENFMQACFEKDVIANFSHDMQVSFRSTFKIKEPWFSQFAKFIEQNNGRACSINKVRLAEHMAESCASVPDTFKALAETVLSLRKIHPIKHPNDIELPFK